MRRTEEGASKHLALHLYLPALTRTIHSPPCSSLQGCMNNAHAHLTHLRPPACVCSSLPFPCSCLPHAFCFLATGRRVVLVGRGGRLWPPGARRRASVLAPGACAGRRHRLLRGTRRWRHLLHGGGTTCCTAVGPPAARQWHRLLQPHHGASHAAAEVLDATDATDAGAASVTAGAPSVAPPASSASGSDDAADGGAGGGTGIGQGHGGGHGRNIIRMPSAIPSARAARCISSRE